MYFPVLGLMTVKNERKNMKRTLQSFHFIDRWLITDTGSTDGTQAKIKAVLKKMNKKYDIIEEKWINYSFNKNLLLDGAKQLKEAYKYTLMIDAGDECENFDSLDQLIYKNFEVGYIPVKTDNKLTPLIYQPRLLKVDTNLHYRFNLHETIRVNTDTVLNNDLKNEEKPFTIIHNYKDDHTRHRTIEGDIRLLKNDLKNPTNDSGDIRNRLENLVYTLLSVNRKEEAMIYFKELITKHYAEREQKQKEDSWTKIIDKFSNISIIEDAETN